MNAFIKEITLVFPGSNFETKRKLIFNSSLICFGTLLSNVNPFDFLSPREPAKNKKQSYLVQRKVHRSSQVRQFQSYKILKKNSLKFKSFALTCIGLKLDRCIICR